MTAYEFLIPMNEVDEIVTKYQHGDLSAERAMSALAALIADYESGEEV